MKQQNLEIETKIKDRDLALKETEFDLQHQYFCLQKKKANAKRE